eukprot:TRINITY_DN4910_c1_g1_i4.p1 TRINITY_DN4910_c1_g1~~TRINITY_DN4910_c1_g1_i4.p1  ORF type:complete len:2051 (-),score=350.63 TRINITY_DN4910_c1_g1_i4:347-6499(-)
MPDHQSTPRAEPPRVFGDNDSVEGVDARERRSPQSDKEQRATKSRVGVDAAAPKTSSRSLCLLVASEVLVELAATVFAAVLLFVYGGGGESAAIRCDLAAVGILAAVTTGFVVQFIAETCSSPDPQRPESTAARVGRLLRTSLRVICAGLVVFAFLAHATLLLAEVTPLTLYPRKVANAFPSTSVAEDWKSNRDARSGESRAYNLPSEYSKTDYDLAAQFPASWDCVNATVDAGWKASVGFDFYVLEPRKSCSVIGSARRLAATSSGLNVSNSTSNVSAEAPASEVIVEGQHVPLFAGTFEVPQAMHHLGSSIGSEWLGQAMEDITGFLMRMFRRAFKVRTRVPQEINLQCASPRRLASGLALLSAVVGISAVAYLDVLSVLAASTEIAKARASTAGGFVRYAMIMARAQAFEQVGWTLLQVGISSAVSLQAEVVGVFKRHCGVLVREDNLYRRECPIFWEAPVDFCATAVIFVALLLGFAAIASVFGGVCFGLSTSRWAVATLFGRYLHISTVTEPSAGTYRPQMSRRMSTDLSLRKHATFHRWLIQPILGLAVTLGVWNTTLTRNFQICNRQNRYQPICVNTQEEQGALVEDLVSWKSMYRATAKLVSLAWLPFPLIGGLLSKACEYMNQHVIFAFGDGGGSTPEDQEPILHYFEEETPHAVHLLHWGTSVAQLFLLVLIQFDIVGMIGNRVLAISICMGVIIVLAILRVAADLVQELKVFLRRRGILDCASQLVADKIPSRVVSSADEDADWAKFGDGVDANPLLGLCVKHRARLVHACAELCELPWVQQGILPSAERSALMSARWRRSPHFQHASKLSRALAAEQENVSEGALRAAILLLLHEVVEVDICKERARKVARFETRARARKHAEDSGQDMHMRAEDEAREQACREARRRVQAIGDVKRLVVAKENRGEHVDIPTDLPCWVRIRFQASRTYKSQMVGRWEATANDLTEVIISSVTSVVSGEVELHWSSTRTNSDFSFADAVVVSSSHKTVPSWEAPPCADDAAHELWDDGEELFEDSACEIQLLDGEGSPVAKAVRGHHAGVPQSEDKESQQEQDEKTCVICSQNEERVPNSGCCRCFSSPSEGQQQHASPGQKWALVDLGVAHGPSDEDVGNAISCPYEDWSWLATVTPVVSIPDVRADLDVEEAMQELEAALRANESVSDAQVLSAAGSFLTALQSSKAQSAVVKAGRRAQMLSVASRMLRTTREGKVEPSVYCTRSDSAAQSDAEEMNTKHAASTDSLGSAVLVGGPAERLRGALGRRPVDADELSVALDEGRRANIDPLLLAQAEERFVEVLDQQRAARLLTQALQSRRIAELRRAVMKAVDAGIDRGECFCGEAVGLVERARAVLREEEENCLRELREAVKAGAAAPLERALEQAHAAGLSSRDQQIFSSAEVLLQRLREREDSLGKLQKAMSGSDIETLRNAIEKYEAVCAVAHESTCASDGDEHLRRGMNLLKKLLVDAQRAKEATATPAMKPPIPPTTVHRPQLTSLKLVRASAMLRGALQQENQDPSVLRLALREAVDAGVVGADVERAEELVRLEDQNDQFLDSLRESSRAKNERAVAEALARCHRKGVDPKRLLAAIVMLIEEHARTALMTGDHGLSCAGLDDLETHRRDLHESIQKGLGGLRRICRIRAPLASERINVNGTGSTGAEVVSTLAASPGDNLAGHGGQMVAFRRLDRVTVVAADERTFRFTSVFGPDSIQAEIFNEVRGLVQSAIDGFNVSIFSCGAQGSGKTYLIRGGTTTEGRGIIPRALDELFAIRDRDAWRATIEVELQMVEVVDSHNLVDILCARGVGGRDIGSRPSVRLSRPNGDRSCGGGNVGVLAPGASHVIIDGAASRLVVNRSQAKTVVEEGFWRRTTREASVASRNGHGGTSEGGASGRGGTHAAIGVAASSIISGNSSVASHPAATTFSHNLILFVHITRTNRANGATSRGKLVFADLAGCGEACPPESNAAYTSFGNVLRALAAGQQRSRVPFRDHALTNLLQDCLGGTSKTALLLSLPPCRSLAGESKAMFEDALRSIDLATCASW